MKIDYQTVIDLGFKRIPDRDIVFFKQNGYEYFRVEMKLLKSKHYKFSLEWDSETHLVRLLKLSRENDILVEVTNLTIDEINLYISLLR